MTTTKSTTKATKATTTTLSKAKFDRRHSDSVVPLTVLERQIALTPTQIMAKRCNSYIMGSTENDSPSGRKTSFGEYIEHAEIQVTENKQQQHYIMIPPPVSTNTVALFGTRSSVDDLLI